MVALRYLSLLVGLLCSVSVYSQTGEGLKNEWTSLVAADDHEKNYRFPAFLESAGNHLADVPLTAVGNSLPSDWASVSGSDTSLMVFSAILKYKEQSSRLICFIRDDRVDFKKVQSFWLDLASLMPADTRPELRMTKEEQRERLDVLLGGTTVLTLPDVELKMLLGILAQSRDDEEKTRLGQTIETRMQWVLAADDLFPDPLKGYHECSTLLSQDEKVKFCTWNIEFNNGTHKYFGILSVKTDNGIRMYPLSDQSASIRSPEQSMLNPSKWYGCIYYDMIETRYKGEVFYTLIGYNGHDAFSQIKLVDVMVLSKGNNPNPRFGHPIFLADKRTRRRLIFEYSNRATMLLRYDAGEKMIVMDNLAPINPGYQNDFRYYGPDFSYNGWKFEKGKWVLHSDIDIRNPSPDRR